VITDEIDLCGYGEVREFSVAADPPVISLTSVVSWDAAITWDVTTMRVSPGGIIRVMTGPPVTGLVESPTSPGTSRVPSGTGAARWS